MAVVRSDVDEVEVTATDVTELVALAKQYQVESLKAACVEYMEQDVTAEKACTLFVEGRKLLNEPGFGLSFIEENIDEIIKTDGFIALTPLFNDRVNSAYCALSLSGVFFVRNNYSLAVKTM